MNTIEFTVERRRAEGLAPNRLIHEKSPYLLQHAFNPVDWYPWGAEAFARSRAEDKPIFLSIVYSTCYWCHVMEREVFENHEIAGLMNRTVINIKVDREERPEVDRVYMAALMGMTGSGGWPMSMFLTPDLKPFFGATYIPPAPRYGRESFPGLLNRIHELWTNDRREILAAGERLAGFLSETASNAAADALPEAGLLKRASASIVRQHDREHGGFGGAPKFPTPVVLDFLLRRTSAADDPEALEAARHTLDRIQGGGIHDHVGGGYHRYATDAAWHVPHFEKMLYDQAQLAIVFLEAYQITGHERYHAAVRDILDYVRRDMTDPSGAFWSAEDAESARTASTPDDKREGAWYLWTKREIDSVVTAEASDVLAFAYDLKADGNVTADAHGMFTGTNILHRTRSVEETARHFGISAKTVEQHWSTALTRLREARNERPRPGLDDKVLTSWNGLMISAFARAYQVLRDPGHLEAAERAALFMVRTMYDPKAKTLLRRYRAGEARFDGLLEDHAFLVQGLLDLYEASFDHRWLRTAVEITDRQIELFFDQEEGGFFDDGRNELSAMVRTKEWHDGATPSANAVAVMNLLRLSAMLHDDRYRQVADRSLRLFGAWMERAPQGTAQWLSALQRRHDAPRQVIVAGPKGATRTEEMLRRVQKRFDPQRVVLLADGAEGQAFLSGRIPAFEQYRMLDGVPTAYVCRDFECQLPTSDPDAVERLLDDRRGSRVLST